MAVPQSHCFLFFVLESQNPAVLSISVSGLLLLLNAMGSLHWFSSRGLDKSNISSNSIRDYLLDGQAHPSVLFAGFFSNLPPVAAITYEWRLSFQDLLSYLNPEQIGLCCAKWGGSLPRDMSKLLIWIDVLFIDQLSANIAGNLMEAKRVYEGAAFHLMLVTNTIFTRAWCLYEFAIRRYADKETLIVESSQQHLAAGLTTNGHFFESMNATVSKDKELICNKIVEAFGNPKRFNMEMLSIFLVAGGRRV
jgi:hypothetical protein